MNRTKINNKYSYTIPKVSYIPEKNKCNFPMPKNRLDMLKERKNEKLLFSFRFLDRDNTAFNLGSMKNRNICICSEWFLTLIDTLKELSNLTRNDLVLTQRNHYDAHKHNWDKLDYRFNFDDDFLEQVECLQFRLSSSKGRVHGFIIGNRFYIVWLDPYHNLYPDERFGGRKFYSKPITCFEKMQLQLKKIIDENTKLKKDNKELMNILDEKTS